jgi:biopolymer transport protein ExbD
MRTRQPIRAPRPWLLSHVGLNKSRGPQKRQRRPTVAGLQLTPMIDMFIVVLIFLLMAFGAGAPFKLVTPDIKLPLARQVDQLVPAPVIAVTHPGGPGDMTGGVVTLEGSEVAEVSELQDENNPDWLVAKLREQLEVHKHNWKLLNQDRQFSGQVVVLADREVDFRVLKRVFYTCGVAGYPQVHLAVSSPARH